MIYAIRNQKGTTLIELIISIAIMLVLFEGFYQLFISLYQSYKSQEAIAEAQQQARVAIGLISREIQQTGYDPIGTAFEDKTEGKVPVANPSGKNCAPSPKAEPIMEAAGAFFHFLADVGEDGNFSQGNDDIGEEIRYEWVGLSGINSCGDKKTPFTLYRDTGGGAQEVASDIESFSFEYRLEDGSVISDGSLDDAEKSLVRKIVVRLTARTDRPDPNYPSNGGYRTRELSSEVWLKNR